MIWLIVVHLKYNTKILHSFPDGYRMIGFYGRPADRLDQVGLILGKTVYTHIWKWRISSRKCQYHSASYRMIEINP